jgi:rare lipoprotein A
MRKQGDEIMRSTIKAAVVCLALSPAAVAPASASAPIAPAEKAARTLPSAADEPQHVRVARYGQTMTDAGEYRPRRTLKRRPARPARHARRSNVGHHATRRGKRPAFAQTRQRKVVHGARPASKAPRAAVAPAPAPTPAPRAAAPAPTGRADNGVASYYSQGLRTANGSRFNPDGMTAAHKTLPFGTKVRVTHLGNGRTVDVTINDRGPFIAGRIIDLSRGAANVIGMTGQGLARVKMEILGR